jgi:light-regulated signal transduction histidine kinase (bacteriophytochrome)
MCQITVADNGIGFEEEYAERIFGIFQRLHGRDKYDGAGVGLAICRKISERHGGFIVGKGRPNEGAEFVVTLPLRHAQT